MVEGRFESSAVGRFIVKGVRVWLLAALTIGLVVMALLPDSMTDPAPPFPSLQALSGKKVTAAFDGGRITSDGGAVLLAEAERKPVIANRLAEPMPELRDPTRVRHLLVDILRAGILAIGTGYEDADDLDARRHDPAFRIALSKTPEAGEAGLGLASQPTLSRWETAPDLRSVIAMA